MGEASVLLHDFQSKVIKSLLIQTESKASNRSLSKLYLSRVPHKSSLSRIPCGVTKGVTPLAHGCPANITECGEHHPQDRQLRGVTNMIVHECDPIPM